MGHGKVALFKDIKSIYDLAFHERNCCTLFKNMKKFLIKIQQIKTSLVSREVKKKEITDLLTVNSLLIVFNCVANVF